MFIILVVFEKNNLKDKSNNLLFYFIFKSGNDYKFLKRLNKELSISLISLNKKYNVEGRVCQFLTVWESDCSGF